MCMYVSVGKNLKSSLYHICVWRVPDILATNSSLQQNFEGTCFLFLCLGCNSDVPARLHQNAGDGW